MGKYCVRLIYPQVRYSVSIPKYSDPIEYIRKWAKKTSIPNGKIFIGLITYVEKLSHVLAIAEFISDVDNVIAFKNRSFSTCCIKVKIIYVPSGEYVEI